MLRTLNISSKRGEYFVVVNTVWLRIRRCYGKGTNLKDYSKCYKILEIPNDSDQESVRKAFIDLCKKYHPDSGKSSADAVKFQEVIESAYRNLQNKFAEERWNVNEGIGEYGLYYKEKKNEEKPEVFDIKHTAPQHRQYLSYEGVGSGTPSQREKQYIKYRTMVAAENVHDHQIKKLSQSQTSGEKTLIVKDKKEARKIKTRYGMERLVEDLIQESMANGQFDNLKGQGKPLPPSSYNPYVDFVTHKMNQVLIDNGFAPEWITLQKEIADEVEGIKETLSKERGKLGPLPLNFLEERRWNKLMEDLKNRVQKLNQKINKFNLVVPMLEKQKLYFNLEKESQSVLESGYCSQVHLIRDKEEIKNTEASSGYFPTDFIYNLFK